MPSSMSALICTISSSSCPALASNVKTRMASSSAASCHAPSLAADGLPSSWLVPCRPPSTHLERCGKKRPIPR
uniref:Putative secreted protein n=1 Tax=Anopheles darlingi TaxID=43151 RepID=A0A2M4DKD6_ANODA